MKKAKIMIYVLVALICFIALAGCASNNPANSLITEQTAQTSVSSPISTETNASGERGESDSLKENGTLEVPNSSKSPSTPTPTPSPTPTEANTIDVGTQNKTPAVIADPSVVEPCTQTGGKTETTVNIHVENTRFTISLYDNASTQALLAKIPLTLNMSELNGNEKYYYLSYNLPTDSQRVGSIHTGDLMLYGSDCLVLFFDSFPTSYNYTPLGYMKDASGLAEALGRGNVQITLATK